MPTKDSQFRRAIDRSEERANERERERETERDRERERDREKGIVCVKERDSVRVCVSVCLRVQGRDR